MESDASGKDHADVWPKGSDSEPVNVEVGYCEGKDEDEELYILPQYAPASAPAAAPKGRAAQPPSLTPACTSEERATSPAPLTTADVSGGRASPACTSEGPEPAKFEGSGVSCSPSVGREGSDCVPNRDAQESPVPSTRGTGIGEAIIPPMLGSPRFKWTAEGPTGTVEGRQRGDVRRLQALHGAALVAWEMGIEAAFEDSVFLPTHDSYVGTLSDLEGKFLIERAADIVFQM